MALNILICNCTSIVDDVFFRFHISSSENMSPRQYTPSDKNKYSASVAEDGFRECHIWFGSLFDMVIRWQSTLYKLLFVPDPSLGHWFLYISVKISSLRSSLAQALFLWPFAFLNLVSTLLRDVTTWFPALYYLQNKFRSLRRKLRKIPPDLFFPDCCETGVASFRSFRRGKM